MTVLQLNTYLQARGSGQLSFSSAKDRTQNELQLKCEQFGLEIANWQCEAEVALRNIILDCTA